MSTRTQVHDVDATPKWTWLINWHHFSFECAIPLALSIELRVCAHGADLWKNIYQIPYLYRYNSLTRFCNVSAAIAARKNVKICIWIRRSTKWKMLFFPFIKQFGIWFWQFSRYAWSTAINFHESRERKTTSMPSSDQKWYIFNTNVICIVKSSTFSHRSEIKWNAR